MKSHQHSLVNKRIDKTQTAKTNLRTRYFFSEQCTLIFFCNAICTISLQVSCSAFPFYARWYFLLCNNLLILLLCGYLAHKSVHICFTV